MDAMDLFEMTVEADVTAKAKAKLGDAHSDAASSEKDNEKDEPQDATGDTFGNEESDEAEVDLLEIIAERSREPQVQGAVPPTTNLARSNANTTINQRGPGAYRSGRNMRDSGHTARESWNVSSGRNTNASAVDMVEAQPIFEESTKDFAAAVDPQLEEQKAKEKALKRRKELCLGACLISLVILLILGIMLGIVRQPSDSETTTMIAKPESQTLSDSPTRSPTTSPTDVLDTMLADLPDCTLKSLDNPFSVQTRAYRWLMKHQNITHLQEWRKKQLFALATFFFAMEGSSWPTPIQKDWLDDSKSECNWYSNEHGYYDDDGTYHKLQGFDAGFNYGVSTCNEKGEFQSIVIDRLALGGLTPSVPPEISMLTSLTVLACAESSIDVSLDNLLPTEIYEMDLQVLDFADNNLIGTIPSELGLLQNMTEVLLYDNALSGRIPREIGALTGLKLALLDGNCLSGLIPSEFGRMTTLYDLTLFKNTLSGTLPSQLGLLQDLEFLELNHNELTGQIPTELGQLAKLSVALFHDNMLTGAVAELDFLVENTSMLALTVHDNSLTGVFSVDICALGQFDIKKMARNWTNTSGLSFNCNDTLCGCSWCPCSPNR